MPMQTVQNKNLKKKIKNKSESEVVLTTFLILTKARKGYCKTTTTLLLGTICDTIYCMCYEAIGGQGG